MEENWVCKCPSYGDHIRVNRGLYYHHGIYKSDYEVYSFQSPIGSEISPETAVVLKISLIDFLKNGYLEVREYTLEELKRKRSNNQICAYAEAHLGEGGYNLLTNNCEHFANRCVFGESSSNQVENVKNLLRGLFE